MPSCFRRFAYRTFRRFAYRTLCRVPFGYMLGRWILWLRLWLHGGTGDIASFWEWRYAGGGTSGAGSYGDLADFKGQFLRDFMRHHRIQSVIDFGCGDGNQIAHLDGLSYTGFDVSSTAIDICRRRYRDDNTKTFSLIGLSQRFDECGIAPSELAMSLDVIFHLIEDQAFELHINNLFAAATRYVVIFSSNADIPAMAPHVRHRDVTGFITQTICGWTLYQQVKNPLKGELSKSDFYVYRRKRIGAD